MNWFSKTVPLLSVAGMCMSQPIDDPPAGMEFVEIDADMRATVDRSLPESRAVGAEFLDPAYDPNVYISQDAHVRVTFVDEGAGYRNTLGSFVYLPATFDGLTHGEVNTDGIPGISLDELVAIPGVISTQLVFPNCSEVSGGGYLMPGDSIDLDEGNLIQAGTRVGFFLIQNAWSNGSVNGWSNQMQRTVHYTIDMLNGESSDSDGVGADSAATKSRHAAMLFVDLDQEKLLLGIEDLHRTDRTQNDYNLNSDEDFNDAVFLVTSDPPEAISSTPVPITPPAFSPIPPGIFENTGACGLDESDLLDTYLPERTNVDAEFMNPIYDPDLIIGETTRVIVTFFDEGATYLNSLGYYVYPEGALDGLSKGVIDSDGSGVISLGELDAIPGVEIGMVFPAAGKQNYGGPLLSGDAIEIGDGREFEAGQRIGFFLVQDGWDDGTVRGFGQPDTGGAVFYTTDRLNPEADPADDGSGLGFFDRTRHVAMLFHDETKTSIVMGFEDLHRSERTANFGNYESDEDFNDVLFCISATVPDALSGTVLLTPGDGGGCSADVNSDGVLDPSDFTAWILAYNSNAPECDQNGDGECLSSDFSAWIHGYSQGCD